MVEENKQQSPNSSGATVALQFGGPEVMHAHESIGCLAGAIEHLNLSASHIQDKQLSGIAMRQKDYMVTIYNVLLETVQTANEPANKITDYHMLYENPTTTFGLTQKPPKKPIQNQSELTDECISGSILSHVKSVATSFTTTALEATNPVLRRVFADAIPNIIELAYEMFLYENQKGYYEVPQYSQTDMNMIINGYQKISTSH